MEPVDDLPLAPSPRPVAPPPPPRDTRAAIAVVVAVLVLAGAVGWFSWRHWRSTVAQPGAQQGAAATRHTDVRTSLGPPADTPPPPALDLSDPFVRDLLGRLSSRPEMAAWLASDDLIRHFVVSLDNVATGATPARHLPSLAPKETFQVVRRGDRLVLDPRTYERYNGLADTLTSLDPADLAKVYATLKPRLVDAYRELGHPDGDIDAAVEQALLRLLDTPVPQEPIELKPGIVSYRFADEELEGLSPAQKLLVRMGPRNMRAIRRQLWALGRELGIPAERLPAPSGT